MHNKKISLKAFFVSVISLILLFSSAVANTKHIIDIKSWYTPNGGKILFTRTPNLPFVTITIVFNAGAARDGELHGIAEETNDLLDEGTKSYSANQIAEGLAKIGAHIFTSVDRDKAIIGLRTLTKPGYLKQALQIYESVISEPTFAPKAVTRIRKQLLSTIDAEHEQPMVLAENEFYKSIYGNTEYGHSINGTKETILKISPSALHHFYEKYYVAKNATLVIVGDITSTDAKIIANEIMSKLPKGQKANTITITSPEKLPKNQTINLPYLAEQTSIYIGTLGIAKTNPDYFPILVGNFILGQAPLISNLFQEVRNKRGLVYSINSIFTALQSPGPFIISMQTSNANTEEAIKTTKSTLKKFLEQGPTLKELAAAKNSLLGSFPLSIANNSGITSILISIGFYDLPLDYLDQYAKKINSVTLDDINKAFNRYIKTDKLITITVGQKANDITKSKL